jgi:hypothetical protein
MDHHRREGHVRDLIESVTSARGATTLHPVNAASGRVAVEAGIAIAVIVTE